MNAKTTTMKEDLFGNFELRKGIWHARDVGEISYPEDGNKEYYNVEDKSFWFVHRNKCILAVTQKYLPAGSLFLDVGGGNGYVARNLQENGYEAVMLEPYLAGCLNAKERGLAHVVHGDLMQSEFPEASFDAIGIFDVLEHISDRAAFLKKIHTLLRPKGKLFVAVPAFQWLWSDEDVHVGHYLRYTKGILKREATAAGFDKLFDSYFFSFLVLPIGLFRAIPSKLKVMSEVDPSKDHAEAPYLQKALRFEINRLKKGKSIGMGSSLMGVYEKT